MTPLFLRQTNADHADQNIDLRQLRSSAAKLESLQQAYAELNAAIFEAAQVHRRLCAPRLVHHGAFDVASEIFAVRHLPGSQSPFLSRPAALAELICEVTEG